VTPIDRLRNAIGSALATLRERIRRIARRSPDLLPRQLPMLPAPVPIPIRTRRPPIPADGRSRPYR
jgi:hypothetical protein